MNIFRSSVNKEDYFVAEYWLESKTNLRDAAWNLAIGQSVGNPNVRNRWETEPLFENHCCLVMGDEEFLKTQKNGVVQIAFPVANIDIDTDGVSQMLCQWMGGQMDIENILSCQLIDVEFPQRILKSFKGPKFGLSGARDFLGIYGKPLLGGIVKPKVGITPDTLLELVKEMVEGGVDFIKEDEIMSNPPSCPLEDRVPLIMNYLEDKKVIYAVCINSDPHHVLNRAKRVYELGANAIHVNFWCGLGTYKAIRDLDLPLFVHFQKSGDKILTNRAHQFHIRWNFICKLAALMGVDFIHAGMMGGYYNVGGDDMSQVMDTLQKGNVVAALSCGMHPGLIEGINKRIGVDYMANCGGAIHGHPGGTFSGVKAMKQAIDGDHGHEYHQAILKWGKGESC
jgi:ribulose 1,5-bisphosphate carboxylase large subunit-like protein